MRQSRLKSLSSIICTLFILSLALTMQPQKTLAQTGDAVSVTYQAHVQNTGWEPNWVSDGQEVGTEGKALRLEALKIKLVNAPAEASIKYEAHVQNVGWQNWVSNGLEAGTDGQSLRVEAIKITLENMPGYSVQYQAHVQNVGWQNWVSDGQEAGTDGQSLRVEAIRIRIVLNTVPVEKQRQVTGKATDLGAGIFQGGKDVQAGLYDVTPVDGEGNFFVTSSGGDLNVNEILGPDPSWGQVSKVRVRILAGDEIELSGINQTHFEPVTTPFVTTVQALSLYTGSWVVGEDIAAGRYKATPASGSGSGNFMVFSKDGMLVTNEILGGDIGVKEVTVNLEDGGIIDIGSINQVNFTPTN
jgi:uncharacterized protein YjdB